MLLRSILMMAVLLHESEAIVTQHEWQVQRAEALKQFLVSFGQLKRDCSRVTAQKEPVDNGQVRENYRSVFLNVYDVQERMWGLRDHDKRDKGIRIFCGILWPRLVLSGDEFDDEIPAIESELADIDLASPKPRDSHDHARDYEEEFMLQEFEILANLCTGEKLARSKILASEETRYQNFRQLDRHQVSAARRNSEFKPCEKIWSNLDNSEKLSEIRDAIGKMAQKKSVFRSVLDRIIPHV